MVTSQQPALPGTIPGSWSPVTGREHDGCSSFPSDKCASRGRGRLPMPNTTHPDGVPLNLWLVPDAEAAGVHRQLARRAIEIFSPVGGVVADLSADPNFVLSEAMALGRTPFPA